MRVVHENGERLLYSEELGYNFLIENDFITKEQVPNQFSQIILANGTVLMGSQMKQLLGLAYLNSVNSFNGDYNSAKAFFITYKSFEGMKKYEGQTLNIEEIGSLEKIGTSLVTVNKKVKFSLKIPTKEDITKKVIVPLIKKWIEDKENISNDKARSIYRNWINSSAGLQSVSSAIKSFGEQSSIYVVSETEIYYTAGNLSNAFLNSGDAYVKENYFYYDLLYGTNTLKEHESEFHKGDLPSVLGFSDFIEDALDAGFIEFIDDPEYGSKKTQAQVTADDIEKWQSKDKIKFAKAFAISSGKEWKEATPEEVLNLKQCALITPLLKDEFFMREYFTVSDYSSSLANNNRVYPVIPSYDPNLFYNKCNVSLEAKKTLEVNNPTEALSGSLFKKLYWVYEDGNSILNEVELRLSTTEANEEDANKIAIYEKALEKYYGKTNSGDGSLEAKRFLGETSNQIYDEKYLRGEINSILSRETSVNKSFYFIKEIDIKFDGTNPSTARNDVLTTFKFHLSSLEALGCTMGTVPSSLSPSKETVEIKLRDLVTLPVTNKITKGPGSYIPTQFNPDYSRVRLKVYTTSDTGSDLIIDLTTIDHKLERSSETGATILTVNYRGYFESSMNMPFNDAIASSETITKREELHLEAMKVIKTNECKPELVKQAMRIEQDIFRREGREASPHALIDKLYNRKQVHSYLFNSQELSSLSIEQVIDPDKTYVSSVLYQTKAENFSSLLSNRSALNASSIGEMIHTKDNKERFDKYKAIPNSFFFLGDLLHAATDCLFVDETLEVMRDNTKNLNLRFILGTFNVPNPSDLNGPPITINPACIPIDLTFFIEWFHATVIGKGLSYYPVGTFIKDLIERLINGIIYDTCFSSLLPGENPPTLRIHYGSSFGDKSFFVKDEKGWFDPNRPFGTDETTSRPLFYKNINPEEENTQTAYNYAVVYQQFPAFTNYLKKDDSSLLRDKPYVPTIFYGKNNVSYNYVSNVSFSKTDSPFLREARYFNSNYGNLSLLANVYDLNFSFVRRKATTFLYPGVIFNFVLLDWEDDGSGGSPYKKVASIGRGGTLNNISLEDAEDLDEEDIAILSKGSDYRIFGQSNPHDPDTLAHILGFGGYYIIKSVTYKLGQLDNVWSIDITSKFLGTDAKKELVRKEVEEEKLEETGDKQVCVEAYNQLVERANELIQDEDVYYEELKAITETPQEGNQDSTQAKQTVGERVPEAPQEEAQEPPPSLSALIASMPNVSLNGKENRSPISGIAAEFEKLDGSSDFISGAKDLANSGASDSITIYSGGKEFVVTVQNGKVMIGEDAL